MMSRKDDRRVTLTNVETDYERCGVDEGYPSGKNLSIVVSPPAHSVRTVEWGEYPTRGQICYSLYLSNE